MQSSNQNHIYMLDVTNNKDATPAVWIFVYHLQTIDMYIYTWLASISRPACTLLAAATRIQHDPATAAYSRARPL